MFIFILPVFVNFVWDFVYFLDVLCSNNEEQVQPVGGYDGGGGGRWGSGQCQGGNTDRYIFLSFC